MDEVLPRRSAAFMFPAKARPFPEEWGVQSTLCDGTIPAEKRVPLTDKRSPLFPVLKHRLLRALRKIFSKRKCKSWLGKKTAKLQHFNPLHLQHPHSLSGMASTWLKQQVAKHTQSTQQTCSIWQCHWGWKGCQSATFVRNSAEARIYFFFPHVQTKVPSNVCCKINPYHRPLDTEICLNLEE